ncbi:MAG: hypothetical protein M3316_04815 [Actinomycetota bacterium]|jgi:beta-mannosidase|nr:hypothetical protein [Actinomycetota bacterium]
MEVERFATVEPLTAAIALSPAPGAEPVAAHTLTLESKETHLEGKAYLVVENPRLWWTHDLGEPALYDLRVSLGGWRVSGASPIAGWHPHVGA